MNRLFILLLCISCNQASEQATPLTQTGSAGPSRAQRLINTIEGGFIQDFTKAANEIQQEEIKEKYRDSLSRVLENSPVLDSMELYVQRVEAVTSNLHSISLSSNDVWFTISASYPSDAVKQNDKDYQVIKSLAEGTTVKRNLYYAGPVEINRPGASYGVFSIPVSLSPKIK